MVGDGDGLRRGRLVRELPRPEVARLDALWVAMHVVARGADRGREAGRPKRLLRVSDHVDVGHLGVAVEAQRLRGCPGLGPQQLLVTRDGVVRVVAGAARKLLLAVVGGQWQIWDDRELARVARVEQRRLGFRVRCGSRMAGQTGCVGAGDVLRQSGAEEPRLLGAVRAVAGQAGVVRVGRSRRPGRAGRAHDVVRAVGDAGVIRVAGGADVRVRRRGGSGQTARCAGCGTAYTRPSGGSASPGRAFAPAGPTGGT